MQDTVKILTRQASPQELSNFLSSLINERPIIEKLRKMRNDLLRNVEIIGRGLRPIAVTLSGTASIAGMLLSLALFDSIKYIITSREVVEGNVPALKLSHDYLNAVKEELDINIITVSFTDLPKYEEAEQLLEILKNGAVILNGVTAELGIWFGRNAGIGRIIILRPLKDKTVLRYL